MGARRDVVRQALPAFLFLAVVPACAHLLFSPLGFNPTDDGFTLAYSRRLLDGQIPHRDFIIIRPFLSPLLHVPIVRWGGDSTFLLSRAFVWLELAAIAWIWVGLVARLLDRRFTILQRAALALVALASSAHTFPIMAWHTIDGLLFTVVGMALAVRRSPPWSPIAGYGVMGLAYLCKQSFLPAPLLVLAVLGDWRRPTRVAAATLPGLAYAAYLAARGALGDGLVQLTSQSDLVHAGLLEYWRPEVGIGVVIGVLVLVGTGRPRGTPARGPDARAWMVAIVPAVVTALALPSPGLHAAVAYGLFGMIAAQAVVWLVDGRALHAERLRLAGLALVLAWSASLSVGYHVPTLASGQLLVVLLAGAWSLAPDAGAWARARTPFLVALAGVTLACFAAARTAHVYREGPATGLVHALDGALAGGHGLRTNENTFLFLSDLHAAVEHADSIAASYTILPGCAGWWVRNAHRNPLGIDWAQGTELARPELVDRAVAELELARGHNVVIVQKVESDVLAAGFTPLRDRYAVVRYVRRNFVKIGETALFELYR